MPAQLKDFLADTASTGAPLRVPAKGIRLPKSNYIGLALVPKNLLPDIGSATTFTPPGGSAAAVTTATLLTVLRTLALNGMVFMFGNGVLGGKRTAFKSDEETVIFGSQRTKRDTGEGEISFSFMFKYAFHNTAFMNQLRLMYTDYDIYCFTDRSVEVLRNDLVEPVFKNVKNGEVTGNNSDVISSGGFDIVVGTDGDIEPEFGQFENLLGLSYFKYSFGTPVVAGTGLTASLNATVVNKTAPGSGTVTNAVLETVQAGTISYSISQEGGLAAPANLTIDSATGVVTIGAGLVAGTYKVVVAAENKAGVMGEYRFKLIAA